MSSVPEFDPDNSNRCLLVQPEFAATNFWYMKDALEFIGAKHNSPPLGLITVASILPQTWEFRLIDLNVKPLLESDWEWADVVCVGGMLPQQDGILNLISEAQRRKKFVMVGGPDPTSQPDLYQHADVLIVGEAENVIPSWLEQARCGSPRGVFKNDKRPDITSSPIPRYDLINFQDYLQITVQYSRGCPFNCEFCDIIELYGRTPRTKSNEQFLGELDALYKLGYRGWIDVVDDNFIGNKRNVKKMLPQLLEWSKERNYPFFYSTECSMNIADDVKLMEQMRDVDFRFVFMGIETPDPELLLATQKSQNTMKPINDRIQRLYDYGLNISAGFILGFDGEKQGVHHSMIQCIEQTGIAVAMVGLLVALPNTQLTRRLTREGRLLDMKGEHLSLTSNNYRIKFDRTSSTHGRDQTTAGLNFIPTRPREDILEEFRRVVDYIYHPKVYMDRVYRTIHRMKLKRKHWPKGWELRRNLRGLVRLMVFYSKQSELRWLFWRNFFSFMLKGPHYFDLGLTLMGSYVHLSKSRQHMCEETKKTISLTLEKVNLKKVYQQVLNS